MAVYFDNIRFEIKKELRKAKKSILICVAWIDMDIYYDIILDLFKKGVSVTIIMTRDKKIDKYINEINSLMSLGAIIEIISLKRIINCMHNKFCIIDRKRVISGSYNWTHNAKENCENVEINDRPFEVIAQYEYEANRIIQINRVGIDSIFRFDKCPYCNKNMMNVIIIDEENECVLVKICSNDTEHFINDGIIVSDEPKRILDYVNNKYDCIDDLNIGLTEEEYQSYKEQEYILATIERDRLLDEFSLKIGFPIHAIGIVAVSTDYMFEGEKYIKMLWFNKFAAEKLEEDYFESFGTF